jgi:hypothetical protein
MPPTDRIAHLSTAGDSARRDFNPAMTGWGQSRSFGDVGSNVRFARKQPSSGHPYTVPTLQSCDCSCRRHLEKSLFAPVTNVTVLG